MTATTTAANAADGDMDAGTDTNPTTDTDRDTNEGARGDNSKSSTNGGGEMSDPLFEGDAQIEHHDDHHKKETKLHADNARLTDEKERLWEALEKIAQWADAYPLEVFPEPDFKRVRRLLEDGGITLDSVSASNMRYVVMGVGMIARDALRGEK